MIFGGGYFRTLRPVIFDISRITPKIIRSERIGHYCPSSHSTGAQFAESIFLPSKRGFSWITPIAITPTLKNNIARQDAFSPIDQQGSLFQNHFLRRRNPIGTKTREQCDSPNTYPLSCQMLGRYAPGICHARARCR